ncbi:MAG TPA: YwiC-like family protein [Stenomitos sp.]
MTLSHTSATQESADLQPQRVSGAHGPAWYFPTISHEHGVYVILLVSFLTGAAAAQQWTLATTVALVSVFAGFQAEHPWVLQIKQRRSWKPRLIIWGSLYSGLALGGALYLSLQVPGLQWLILGAIAAFILDAIAVFYRQQKSIANELLTFAAACLAAPFAAVATTGTWSSTAWGLWLLNTLFFSSTIFSLKLRKLKNASFWPGLLYHSLASAIIVGLWYGGILATLPAIAFGIVLVKFGAILWQLEWYKTAPIQAIARIETISALLFLSLTALSLLPARLPLQ